MKWVKLKERKPEHGQLCLVWARSADPKMPFKAVTTFYKGKEPWPWLVKVWAKAITHWMPFPNDPKL